MTLTVLDLFSGIGGFSLGLERAGMVTVQFCEIAPKCRHLLTHHWPKVPVHDDVRTLTASQVKGRVDVICGGFPCQDISLAGKGAGITGARSGLWSEYARLIGEFRPRFVIVENVSALLVRGMGTVLGDLAALGYDAWWDCIPASAVGAPHRRDRLWIVAYPRSQQYQGFGDALRRSIAAELSSADRLAYAPGEPERKPANQAYAIAACGEARPEPGDGCSHLADAARLQSERSQQRPQWQRTGARSEPVLAYFPDANVVVQGHRHDGTGEVLQEGVEGHERSRGALPDAKQWLSEPDVGRVAHGVPARVDRLHGLGNAVVPEIPYRLGRAILTALASLRAAA